MKISKPLIWLSWLVALLALISAGFGLFWQGISQLNAGITFSAGQFIGLIGSWVVMGLIALALMVAYFRNITE